MVGFRMVSTFFIAFLWKAFNHCLRFMHGYRSGLVGPVLEYAVKKYKSHRRLSPLYLSTLRFLFQLSYVEMHRVGLLQLIF